MKFYNRLSATVIALTVASFSFAQPCNDGIQNGSETGIDCGGTCPPCAVPCSITLTAEVPPVQGGCCTYVFEMYDSFGDSWNGNTATISINGTSLGSFTCSSGSFASANIAVCDGDAIDIDYNGGGSWMSEVSFALMDGDGNEVYASPQGPAATSNIFIGSAACFNPGVLDCNGGNVVLTAQGMGASFPAINNDFDSGAAGTGWNTNITASFSNPCDASIDGGTYMWMGSSAPHPRIIETVPLDLSCGGEVCFWLDFATQGNASPCEGIDLPDEGVYLEYSTNGGATWTTIEYFGPAGVGNSVNGGGTDPQMTSWNQYCYQIPAAAQTPTTLIHWAQTGSSGNVNDHWGIDNVTIMSYVNCAPYWYDYDNLTPGTDPAVQTVNVTSSGTYNVTYTNGTDACSTSVSITLPPCGCPTATVSGGGAYCVGNDIPDVTFTVADGQYPITVTYAIDGVTQPPLVISQPDSVFTNPIEGVYSILAVTDPSACTGTFSGTADVIANPSPILTSFTGGDSYCTGETVGDIIVQATGNGTLTVEYTLDGVAQTPVSGSSPLNLGNTTGVYELTLLGDAGCTTPAAGTQTIEVNPIPLATAGTTTPLVCVGEDVLLTANTSTGTYNWSGPNGYISTVEDPTIVGAAVNASGTYTLTITENGCTSPPSTVNVAVNPLPNVSTNSDMTICEGTDVTLAGQGAITYTWNNGVTNGTTFTPSVGSITYTVTGTQNGCSASASVTVTVLPLPVADADASINSGYAPLPVTFTNSSSNATSFIWDLGNGTVVPSNTTAPISTNYGAPGTYYVVMTASNGVCDSTWLDTIVVITYPAMTIHVPNVFSPNGDGSNDEYVIDVVNGKVFEMTIINRWGNHIITINELNKGWDGKIDGKVADDGVYFVKYSVEGLDGTVEDGHTYFHLVK